MSTQTESVVVPSWLADMDFCHIVSVNNHDVALCGVTGTDFVQAALCDPEYDGEAICPSCGHPTCPRCAQLSALEDRLEQS